MGGFGGLIVAVSGGFFSVVAAGATSVEAGVVVSALLQPITKTVAIKAALKINCFVDFFNLIMLFLDYKYTANILLVQ